MSERYNSFIYSTTTATEFYATIVSPAFLSAAPYNTSAADIANGAPNTSDPTILPILDSLKGGAANGSLQNLSSSECFKVYAADLQSSYRNFLAITNYSSNLSPIIAILQISPLTESQNYWSCMNNAGNQTTNCSTTDVLHNVSSLNLWSSSYWKPQKPGYNVSVSYCLAEKIPTEGCSVYANQTLLAVIIVANITKLACMILLLRKANFPTLVTLGDAVASFLDQPDPHTLGHALGTIDFDGYRGNRLTKARTRISHTRLKFREIEDLDITSSSPRRLAKAPKRRWLQNPPENRYSVKLWLNTWFSAVSQWEWFISIL